MKPAHPVADLFPMLLDDELKDLAADIKERGLLQPIILDDKGRILDGRNRDAACELASVEPKYVTYEGDDPEGYALAVNLARRHLTKGQQAMIAAKAVHFLNSVRTVGRNAGISSGYIANARTVIDHAPDFVDQVVSGAVPLNDAYKEAQARKGNAESKERKLAWLREQAPDLADLVVEERMTLGEATAAAKEREEKQKAHAARVSSSLRHIVNYCAEGLSGDGLREEYAQIYDDSLGDTPPYPVNAQTIRAAADSLIALASTWEEERR